MTTDNRNCFERIRNATVALCGSGDLPDRLSNARSILAPLLEVDFPTRSMRDTFDQVTSDTGADRGHSVAAQVRSAAMILDLYTQACKLSRPAGERGVSENTPDTPKKPARGTKAKGAAGK